MRTHLWFLLLAIGVSACAATTTGDSASRTRQDHVTFTKSVPAAGNFVMYAFPLLKQVHTLGYTADGAGKTSVEEKTTALREEDEQAFERVFTFDRMTTYRSDEWQADGGSAQQTCPEAQRVCSPAAPGQTQTDCICLAPPGSVSAVQYDVVFDGVAEAQHGMFTFREPMSAVTTEMVTALESMRQYHFGK